VVGLCRTMEHGIGCGSPAPGCQARTAEGVMVRRPSVASLDSSAELPVYGEEPTASADRGNPAAKPSWAGGGRWTASPTETGRLEVGVPRFHPDGSLLESAGLGGIASLPVSSGGATRGNDTLNVDWALSGQVRTGAPLLITTCAMSVLARQSGRWYVKDIRASTQPMGNPMTWFASSWVVPRGPRSPRKHADVHGREG
jgi:hypothetical protein